MNLSAENSFTISILFQSVQKLFCRIDATIKIEAGVSLNTIISMHDAGSSISKSMVAEEQVENQDVFCNSALEAFIQAEFTALKEKTDGILKELEKEEGRPKDIVYNTPSQQSGYVKTLETVLSRQSKKSSTSSANCDKSIKQTDLSVPNEEPVTPGVNYFHSHSM